MRRLFSHDDFSELEAELREGRAEPRAELLSALSAQVEGAARNGRTVRPRRPRAALALSFAVIVLVVFGAFGGVGYAKSSVAHAAKSCANVVKSVSHGHKNNGNNGNNNNNGGNDPRNTQSHHSGDPWVHQYNAFVFICFPIGNHRVSILVPQIFVQYLVPPGTLGFCR